MAMKNIRVEGPIAYIELTKGHEAIVDISDLIIVAGHSWYALPCGNTVYAVRWAPIISGIPRQYVWMHRLIMNTDKSMECDHINMNGIDNRRANLRNVTRTQNRWNTGVYSSNKSGYKGVSWNKHGKAWVARISRNGKEIYLGKFAKIEDAHAAYSGASMLLHGEFRRLRRDTAN